MFGDYYGYDGPCPPWNDELVHRYVFTLYALDVAQARRARAAIHGNRCPQCDARACPGGGFVQRSVYAESAGEGVITGH